MLLEAPGLQPGCDTSRQNGEKLERKGSNLH